MAVEFTMPKFGEVMEEGTIVSWKKAPGDRVEQGEILMEIETDKALLEVEAPASGTLVKILVPEQATVPVGAVLAIIGEPGGTR